MKFKVAVVGSGPAALMAADRLSSQGVLVVIFEKRRGLSRKFLIAGSSGLNITNSLPLEEFVKQYSGDQNHWKTILYEFGPKHWIEFIESLGIGTFEGTSGRYFVETMKASKLLRAWQTRLESQGVQFEMGLELVDVSVQGSQVSRVGLKFSDDLWREFDSACLCLGGGSYEDQEIPLRWPHLFQSRGIGFTDFEPSNVGWNVAWSSAFLKEAEGKPIKQMILKTAKGQRQGELMVTHYGLEGTPIYTLGAPGQAFLDLKPDLSIEAIVAKLKVPKENLSPIRRIKRVLNLDPATLALIFHHSPKEMLKSIDLTFVARCLKRFPIELQSPRPLTEAISSSGGLQWDELDPLMMLRKLPGFFAAGELLDWDAPTGGFLIQGCVSQGYAAAQGLLKFLNRNG